jgi:sigma-B regulation protein RsbU (phosphoserine phosphatase)
MNPAKSYWKTIPRKSWVGFLLAVFLVFSTTGFINDIMEMGRQPLLRLVLGVVLSGAFAMFYAGTGFALRKHFWKAFVPAFIVHVAVMAALARWLPAVPQAAQTNAAEMARLQTRLTVDGVAVLCAIGLGYGCFLYVTITELRRYLRVHAEMALAAEIHSVLVPPIDSRAGEFQFYGRALPSGEVGGDLIDLAGSDEQWVAYVADVSGHGVAPGVVMAMVKSAARMLLSSSNDTEHLLARLNEVLYPLKKPNMFVTFSFVARNGAGLRVGLAGHPDILHFSAGSGEIRRFASPNLPLAILPAGDFATCEVRAEPGDVLVLYTDGLLEAANGAGEEFGLERLQAEFLKHAKEPLDMIWRSLQESVARHGAQSDDQSLFLIRRV